MLSTMREMIVMCRVWEGAPHVEVEWTVGPIPINDDLGVCMRYDNSTSHWWLEAARGPRHQSVASITQIPLLASCHSQQRPVVIVHYALQAKRSWYNTAAA